MSIYYKLRNKVADIRMGQHEKDVKSMLVECAIQGGAHIETCLADQAAKHFFSWPVYPSSLARGNLPTEYLYSSNPGVFYSFLSIMAATDDLEDIRGIVLRNGAKEDLLRAQEFIERALYCESAFERSLRSVVASLVQLEDLEIKNRFNSFFTVSHLDMLELPEDGSIFYAKVNHGLWEFFRGAFDEQRDHHREKFRAIDDRYMIREARTSGLAQLWGYLIHRFFHAETGGVTRPGHTTFGISLTAGTESPARTLRKEFSPVSRGAAMGALAMFGSALPNLGHIELADGGAPRTLIQSNSMKHFFDKYIADMQACLFLVPPHLKQIELIGYTGDVYKLLVPPSKVDSTWKAFFATCIGYIQRLGRRYDSIAILAQGASMASALALLMSEMETRLELPQVRFFDLGRVLDVASPEVLQRQAWAHKQPDELIAAGAKIFRIGAMEEVQLATVL